jgi:hypothetical protein
MSGRANRHQLLQGAELLTLDPADIFVPERIGFMHEDKAKGLGRMIAVDGQRDPIKVARLQPKKTVEQCLAEGEMPWKLVVGWTRLRGCQIEGIEVLALEVKGTPQELAEIEASENIDRREMGPLEKAKYIAALADAARARVAAQYGENISDQQRAIKARWMRARSAESGLTGLEQALHDETGDTRSTMERVYGWEHSVRDAFGIGRASIWRFTKLYRMLIEPFPELAEPLARHPVVGESLAQLLKIADLRDDGIRRSVIEALLADPEVGVDAAMVKAGLKEPEGDNPRHKKIWSQVSGGWGRFGLGEKRQYLPEIATEMLSTPGLKLAMHAILSEQIEALRAAGKLEEDDV